MQYSSSDPYIAEIRRSALQRIEEADAAKVAQEAEELDDLEERYRTMMSTNAAKKVRLAQREAKARGKHNARLAAQLAAGGGGESSPATNDGDDDGDEEEGDVSDLVNLIELGLEDDYSGSKGLRQLLQGIHDGQE